MQKQKLTLPIIHLLTQVSPADSETIRELLAHPDRQTREALLPWLDSRGSLNYARTRAEELTVTARGHLACLPDSPARQLLEDMADFVTIRTA